MRRVPMYGEPPTWHPCRSVSPKHGYEVLVPHEYGRFECLFESRAPSERLEERNDGRSAAQLDHLPDGECALSIREWNILCWQRGEIAFELGRFETTGRPGQHAIDVSGVDGLQQLRESLVQPLGNGT